MSEEAAPEAKVYGTNNGFAFFICTVNYIGRPPPIIDCAFLRFNMILEYHLYILELCTIELENYENFHFNLDSCQGSAFTFVSVTCAFDIGGQQ